MRTHDLTGPGGATLLFALRGERLWLSPRTEPYSPCPHCKVLVRGAHSCKDGRAAA